MKEMRAGDKRGGEGARGQEELFLRGALLSS